jgi:hypothetical protein
MLKTVIAALALSAGAVMVSTAAPAFASTGARTLTIGPQITVTVSCPADKHAVDHDGQLGCVSDDKYRTADDKQDRAAADKHGAADDKHRHADHKSWADRHAKPKPKPAAKPAVTVVNPPLAQAPWQQWPLEHEYGWQGSTSPGQYWHDGYDSGHHWGPWA